MTEQTNAAPAKKAKKYFYHPTDAAGFNGNWYTSNISLGADDIPYTDIAGEQYDGQKYQIGIENIDLEAMDKEGIVNYFKERWNLSLNELASQFATFVFTKPTYKADPEVKKLIEAGDFTSAHTAAQKLIDDYRFNVKKERVTVSKAEAQEVKGLKAMADKLGISFDELVRRAAQM